MKNTYRFPSEDTVKPGVVQPFPSISDHLMNKRGASGFWENIVRGVVFLWHTPQLLIGGQVRCVLECTSFVEERLEDVMRAES